MRKGRETKGTRKIEIKEEREWQSAEVFTVPAAGVRTARGHAVSCWIARLWVIVATAGRSRPEKVAYPASARPMLLPSRYFNILLPLSTAITLTFFLKIIKRASHWETMFGERWLSHCPWEKTVE